MTRPIRLTIAALMLASLALLASCSASQVPARSANYDGLPTAGRQSARISDPAITADRRFMSSLQTRLGKLNAGGVAAKNYHLTKAGAWLDFAIEEYSDNDRTGIVDLALEQALFLTRGLEAKEARLPMDTTIIAGSRRVRDDLWTRIANYKQERAFDCIADRVAKLEVQLVWAGHEDIEGGWRHAKPYIEIAEDMAAGIDTALADCGMRRAAVTKPIAPRVSATAASNESSNESSSESARIDLAKAVLASSAKPIAPVNEALTLSADALFRFDGASSKDVVPAGREQLDRLVGKLKGLQRIERVLVTGHSDRLGDAPYNLRLSQARAETVRQYLIDNGISAGLVQSAGAGESEPLVTCNGDRASAGLVDCLQPNRRVEVRIIGVRVIGEQLKGSQP